MVSSATPVEIGTISPWLDLELVAQVKRYYALLNTLHDSYPDIFTTTVREEERKAFIALHDDMRKKKEFIQHHIAMVDAIGLNFDKPVEKGAVTTVRVFGLYRYYFTNTAYQARVDSGLIFRKESGKCLTEGVK